MHQGISEISIDLFLTLRMYYNYLPMYVITLNYFLSYRNVTMNYARWQLLRNEYDKFVLFLNNRTTSQACAQIVEKFMPFAIARPFVEEFITEKVIHQVNISKFVCVHVCMCVCVPMLNQYKLFSVGISTCNTGKQNSGSYTESLYQKNNRQ